jgi:hypothetical protein
MGQRLVLSGLVTTTSRRFNNRRHTSQWRPIGETRRRAIAIAVEIAIEIDGERHLTTLESDAGWSFDFDFDFDPDFDFDFRGLVIPGGLRSR